jgi:lipopolysaccharide biosynthesis glycosyltransferase
MTIAKKFSSTIVSACDSNYFWGAFLLACSIQYNKLDTYFHLLGYKLENSEREVLSQFESCQVISVTEEISRSLCTVKPLAIKSATTDFVTWLDADCLVKGDISEKLAPNDEKFYIRFRELRENASVYLRRYQKISEFGFVAQSVLDIWKKDVAERNNPRFSTTVLTNCFTFHKKNLSFIENWEKQMEKVIPASVNSVYQSNSTGYFMTDESVLNSLFLFASTIPEIGLYPYDNDDDGFIIHFGVTPKPWQQWTIRHFQYFDYVIELLDWAARNGMNLPELPSSFQKKNRQYYLFKAYITSFYPEIKTVISSKLRKWMLML